MPHQDIPSRRTMSVLDLGTRIRLSQISLLDTQIRLQQSEDRHHAEDACNRFVCKTWEPVDHYSALAHAARAGRAELRADHLLPGDAIELDSYVLTVEHVTVTSHLAIIAVAGFDWSRSLNRDRLVRLA